MNINKKILEEISDELLSNYDCSADKFVRMFKTPPEDIKKRKTVAKLIIEEAMTGHEKKNLWEILNYLGDIESKIHELQPYQRDHVVHSVTTFVIGVYIKKLFPDYFQFVTPFQWKMSAFFHDIAYPIEIASKVLVSYRTEMKEVMGKIGFNQNINHKIIVDEQLYDLFNDRNSLNLIQLRLNEWHIKLDVGSTMEEMQRNGAAWHSLYSALYLLKIIDGMYQNNPRRMHEEYQEKWNDRDFTDDIVSCATAIFLHGINKSDLIINVNDSPLAYLLKLSDSLQDWERPNEDQPFGYSAHSYDIYKLKNELHISVPSIRYDSITEELGHLEGITIQRHRTGFRWP